MKKILVLCMALTATVPSVQAQLMLTYDAAAVIQTIENGYKLYEQLVTLYGQLEYAVQQAKAMKDMAMSIDFSTLDLKDPLGSFRTLVSTTDRLMTHYDNIENAINQKRAIAGVNVSIADVFTKGYLDENGNLIGEIEYPWDPFTIGMTDKEVERLYQRYGMTPAHFAKVKALESAVTTYMEEVVANTQFAKTEIVRMQEVTEKMANLDVIPQNEFEVSQRALAVSLGTMQQISTLAYLYAQSTEADQLYKKQILDTMLPEFGIPSTAVRPSDMFYMYMDDVSGPYK